MTTTRNTVAKATPFVTEAEQMTNERDLDGIRTVFTADGHQTATLDGLPIKANGINEIHRAWATMCTFTKKRQMYIEKTLVTADETTIVNEWVGVIAGKEDRTRHRALAAERGRPGRRPTALRLPGRTTRVKSGA
jgi:hypothetical protein